MPVTPERFFGLGHAGDLDWLIADLVDGTLFWRMQPGRVDRIMSGESGRHCSTCTCTAGQDGSVIEDAAGRKYTKLEFAMQVLCQIESEVRLSASELPG
jgi:hypothetical protein